MKRTFAILLVFFALITAFAQETESTQTESFTSPVSLQEAHKAKAQLFRKLVAKQAPGAQINALDLFLDEEDWQSLEARSEGQTAIGVTKNLDIRVELGPAWRFPSKKPFEASFGVAQHHDDGFVWTAMISSEDARGMRLRFTDFHLPEGAAMYVYSDLGQAYGPYTGLGPKGNGKFWSDTLFAEATWIQVEAQGAIDAEQLGFTVKQLAHFTEEFKIGANYIDRAHGKYCPGSSGLTSCFENVRCHDGADPVDDLKQAVAWIKYQSDSNGNWYGCTGSLINPSSGGTSDWPLFLTAAHCVNSSAEADSMEAYFDYKTNGCNSLTGNCGSAYDDANKVSGATLLATNNASNADYSLLKLSDFPNGSYTKLGWNAGDYSDNDGETLYRVSHPNHYPQAYSEHEVDTSVSTCYNNDRPTYIYTRHTLGYTEGGSSGAPLVNANSQIVGTDRGRCSDTTCDDALAMRDGSFRYQFYDKLRPFIKPTDIHVEDIIVAEESSGGGYRAEVRVQVLDKRDVPVSGALVQMMVAGPIGFPVIGVTDDDGWATAYSPTWPNSATWTACITLIIHPWLTWNPSEDVESCDTN